MTGLGRKVWGRETLSSADLQGYLQDQVVARFPSSAARGVAIPQPTEGMVATLDDTGRTERWDPANNNGAGGWEPMGMPAIGWVPTSVPGAALGAGQKGDLATGLIRARPGQRMLVRVAVDASHSTAQAQTNQLQAIRFAAGTGTVVLAETANFRQPSANDVTNWRIVSEHIVDVTTVNAQGQVAFAWSFQVGTGGATVTLTGATCRYLVGAPAL